MHFTFADMYVLKLLPYKKGFNNSLLTAKIQHYPNFLMPTYHLATYGFHPEYGSVSLYQINRFRNYTHP